MCDSVCSEFASAILSGVSCTDLSGVDCDSPDLCPDSVIHIFILL